MLPQLTGNVGEVLVSSLLQSCYLSSQTLPRVYQHYGPAPIQPLSAEMQILLTVYYLVQLGQCVCGGGGWGPQTRATGFTGLSPVVSHRAHGGSSDRGPGADLHEVVEGVPPQRDPTVPAAPAPRPPGEALRHRGGGGSVGGGAEPGCLHGA